MENSILLDANVLVAMGYPNDPHHGKATDILASLIQENNIFITNNYLVSEALTIMLLRTKSVEMAQFLFTNILGKHTQTIITHRTTEKIEQTAYQIFSGQKKFKGEFLSFIDCTLLAQAKQQQIKTIFTFDETFLQYKKEFTLLGI